MRSGWVYRDVTGQSDRTDLFALVPTPEAAWPGDILVKPGHVRWVERPETTSDGALILHLIESISAQDVPCEQDAAEVDVGPRRMQVRYPHPDRPIGEQAPQRHAWGIDGFESDEVEPLYVLGRLRSLEGWVQTHPPPITGSPA